MMGPRERAPRRASQCMHGIGALDLIEHDPRPTFVVDSVATVENGFPAITYWNTAFAGLDCAEILDGLPESVIAPDATPAPRHLKKYAGFLDWISEIGEATPRSYVFSSGVWTKFTVSQQWTIISASSADDAAPLSSPASCQHETPSLNTSPGEEALSLDRTCTANAEIMQGESRQQLIARQEEAEQGAMKFKRFADHADIGIFIVGLDGVYTYRNDAWWTILDPEQQYRDIELSEAWEAFIDHEFIQTGQDHFQALIETKKHQTWELRLKRTMTNGGGPTGTTGSTQEPRWVLLSIQPELSETGEIVEIVGCFQDISMQKLGEKLQATQKVIAQESKRKLENFIDTTSHEMRNPLSAIVQCADGIISSHKAFEQSVTYSAAYKSISDITLDAAITIVQCSKHMRTIVDDILTISKLDSGLFNMTPVHVPLEAIARDAVKMFQSEAQAAGVALDYQPEASCSQAGMEYVSLDTTRVLQILINLITNAIKFTKLETTRNITVRLGVSSDPPLQGIDKRITFRRSPGAEVSQTLQSDWEKGKAAYVIFSVHDTGRGLSSAEHDLLFARFSQTSPRTHIDYGGSGLGLFISRRLTELHGGAIGFASKAKVGSTFSFYVKCRKSLPPSAQDESTTSLSMRAQSNVLAGRSRLDTKQIPAFVSEISNGVESDSIDVLIVEDNLVNQRVLAKQLKNLGMRVTVANHGMEALEHLRKTQYCMHDSGLGGQKLSLILLDWEMPIMDGLTCVREIRNLQSQGLVKGHVPVIAVTANVRSEQVAQALDAGMDDVISKPFRIPELCDCMHKTILSVKEKYG